MSQPNLGERDAEGLTALARAVRDGNTRRAKRLLAAGAKVHVNDDAKTDALAICLREGNIDTLKLLLPHSDPNKAYSDGSVPLLHCLLKADLVETLVSADATVSGKALTNIEFNFPGYSATPGKRCGGNVLHFAVFSVWKLCFTQRQHQCPPKGELRRIFSALIQAGVGPNSVNWDDETAAQMALSLTSPSDLALFSRRYRDRFAFDVAWALLKAGVDFSLLDCENKNIWHHLLSYYSWPAWAIKELLSTEFYPLIVRDLMETDSYGMFPADYAFYRGTTKALLTKLEALSVPSHYDGLAMRLWRVLYSSFMIAAPPSEILQQLEDVAEGLGGHSTWSPAQVLSMADPFGNTLLHAAVAMDRAFDNDDENDDGEEDGGSDYSEVVQRLLQMGADSVVNAKGTGCDHLCPSVVERDSDGARTGYLRNTTAAALAVSRCRLTVLRYLLAAGADTAALCHHSFAPGHRGEPMLHRALINCNAYDPEIDEDNAVQIVEALVEAGADCSIEDDKGVSASMAAVHWHGSSALSPRDPAEQARSRRVLDVVVAPEDPLALAFGLVDRKHMGAGDHSHFIRSSPAMLLALIADSHGPPYAASDYPLLARGRQQLQECISVVQQASSCCSGIGDLRVSSTAVSLPACAMDSCGACVNGAAAAWATSSAIDVDWLTGGRRRSAVMCGALRLSLLG